MAAYGLDVLDPAAVTPRRLAVLLDQLPPQYRNPGEHWSTEADLLAVLVDQVAQLTYITAKAAGAKNVRPPRPIPRPAPPSAAVAQREAAPSPAPGEVKHGTWAGAIAALAGMPGVEVSRDG
jgi:hypothetical protein